jgi:hypothetical protein
MIAPAAVACKRLLSRGADMLRHHHKPIGCPDRNTGIIGTEARDLAEAMARAARRAPPSPSTA